MSPSLLALFWPSPASEKQKSMFSLSSAHSFLPNKSIAWMHYIDLLMFSALSYL